MRILHVIAGADHGGAETFFVDAVTALSEVGLSQTAVIRPNGAREVALRCAGIEVRTARFGWFRAATHRVIDAAARDFGPDIIQHWMGRAGSFAAPRAAVNVGWYGGYYDPRRFAQCSHHVGVTEAIRAHLVAEGVPAARAATLHTFAEDDGAPAVERAAHDTPADAPLLLALARLHPKKGLDTLLEALSLLPGAYLWIAGDGPLRTSLPKFAERVGVAERVRFLGWRNDRYALLRTCDVCVFPSRYEPFGTVMLEAWAAGTAIVAAAAAGPKAYLRDGETGLLVPVDDARALAEAVGRVSTAPGLRARLIEGGRVEHAEKFSRSAFQRAALAYYEAVLATTSVPARA